MFTYRALFLAVLRGDDCLGFLVPGRGSLPSICSEEDIDITSLRRCSCFVGRLQRKKVSLTGMLHPCIPLLGIPPMPIPRITFAENTFAPATDLRFLKSG